MKTAIKTDYHASILVPGNVTRAWEAIGKVTSWWTKNVTGSSKNQNDIFEVHFGETFSRFRISESIPGKTIRWYVMDCNLHWMKDKKEWKDTEILWEISSVGNSTQIEMTHIGLVPGKECFEDCNTGWNHYIKVSLYKLLTENKGEPDHKDHSATYRQ
jgi:hypothetical protein